jgi:polysaccharide export outer membrane protein
MPTLAYRVFVALTIATCVAACSPGGDLPLMAAYDTHNYKLGAGDQIRLITFGVDQLTNTFTVDDAGNLAVPLVGTFPVAGLTTGDLEALLKSKLRSGEFVRDPSVSAEVLVYRPIFVLGEVTKPGQYPFVPGMTMLSAVASAGGFTYRAVEDYAYDVRSVGGNAVQGKITPNSFLAPGDVVKVYERHF